MWFSVDMAVLGQCLDSMISKVFSDLKDCDSVIFANHARVSLKNEMRT